MEGGKPLDSRRKGLTSKLKEKLNEWYLPSSLESIIKFCREDTDVQHKPLESIYRQMDMG